MLENISIVEYEDKYAAGVADMWNRSSEGWMGDNWNLTEELVKNQQAVSNDIKLYLAIHNQNEVIDIVACVNTQMIPEPGTSDC